MPIKARSIALEGYKQSTKVAVEMVLEDLTLVPHTYNTKVAVEMILKDLRLVPHTHITTNHYL